jgi:hypothetical protein
MINDVFNVFVLLPATFCSSDEVSLRIDIRFFGANDGVIEYLLSDVS